MDWGRKWLVDFNDRKTQLVSSDQSNSTGITDVKRDCYVLFGSILFCSKAAPQKTGVLIRSLKFLSPEFALYLHKSTMPSCMEYCCHVYAGAPSSYLELLVKLQKRICGTVGYTLAASLEPLAHCQNVASLSLFYRYYFGRYSCELAQLVPLPYSRGRTTGYSDRLHNFLSPFRDITSMSM